MPVDRKAYWRRQVRRTVALLVVWAVAGLGLSILFVENLNHIMLGDMPLGFWMAQQGSIFIFILLILIYAVLSGRADREFGLTSGTPPPPAPPPASSSTSASSSVSPSA